MARHTGGIPPTVSLTLSAALWGIATVISKDLLASVPPITFLLIQLVPSVCALWVLVLATGDREVARVCPISPARTAVMLHRRIR